MKFKEHLDYFDNKQLKKGERLISLLLSLGLSLLIVSGPIVLAFNLLTFSDYRALAALLIGLCIIAFITLFSFFYMKNIVKDDDIKFGKLVLLIFCISLVVVFGFLLIAYKFGVI